MKPGDLMIRCLAMREGDQWVGICLPFDLVAQGDTIKEMQEKLHEQIVHYLQDALVGEDRKHAAYLLARRAPLKYWAKYYFVALMEHVHKFRKARRFKTPIPLEPATC